MIQPLPGRALELPRGCRIRVGERYGGRPQRRFYFDLAIETGEKEFEYVTHNGLMRELAETLGYQCEEENGQLYIVTPTGRKEFRPKRIPVELISDRLSDWLVVRLSRWSGSGPQCIGRHFRLKNSETGSINPDLPTSWIGEARILNEDGEFRDGICDPETCPHFRPNSPTIPPCKPEVQLHVRLPWAGQRSWAWFHSTSWHSARMLMTTAGDLASALGGILRGVQCLLVVQPVLVRAPDGKRYRQPIVYLALDKPISQVREELRHLVTLTSLNHLPAPEDFVVAFPERTAAIKAEFHPEIQEEEEKNEG